MAFTAIDTEDFKESQECTSRGRRVQSSRKHLENDDIAEEAVIRKRVMGGATMDRALQMKAMNGPGRPNLKPEG